VLYNDYGHGERHDARLDPIGWDDREFDAGDWLPATVRPAPAAALRSALLEPARVIETRQPSALEARGEGCWQADFGQNFGGWTRITVRGPAGAEVTLRHAAEVSRDGTLDDDANMGAWLPARQTDTYVLAGSGQEIWEPRFTLHGFRHVEVSASDAAVALERIEGRVVHSDVQRIGQFECSDELLNQIHANVLWSHRTSFQGFPQDAAERYERVGWVGDPGWGIDDYLYNFDARAFWCKWLEDLADAQLADGRFPLICPIQWRGGIDMVAPEDYVVPEDLDTMVYWPYAVWPDFSSTSYPAIAWALYEHSGDRSILSDHYPAMRRGLEYLRSIAEHQFVELGFGDHMEPQPDGTCSVFALRTPSR
jgi:alpha-L-rhamnosidase